MHHFRLMTVAALCALATQTASAPTYTKDVAPILFHRCAECHRSGEAAPMQTLEL